MKRVSLVLLAAALFQCAFCGSVTITTPSEDSVGSGTCMTINWVASGLKSIQSFNIFFEYEDGTEAFTKTTTTREIDIVFPDELVTYKFHVQAIYGTNGKTLNSTKKTVTIADHVCYPNKITNLINDPSFENAYTGATEWSGSPDLNFVVDSTTSQDYRKSRTGKYYVTMGAEDRETDQTISQRIRIDSNTKYIGFWSQSIITGDASKHYIELLLGDITIKKWISTDYDDIMIATDAPDNYTFALIEIPAEAHTQCDDKKCDLKLHAYSIGLTYDEVEQKISEGIQGGFDDFTVGPCTAFSKDSCKKNCKWCASQNMCIDSDVSCTSCGDYNSVTKDKNFGCNWAEGCWYCYVNYKCIEDGDTSTPGCVKDCTDSISAASDNCNECPTLDNQKVFYLDYDELCPSCNTFTNSGSSVCESKNCQWCTEISSCEDKYVDGNVEQPAECKTCESLETISECDSKTACSWCYTNNKCQNLKTECTNECSGITKSDECSGDCTWCFATETCMAKREVKSDESLCPACALTDCDSTKYPGCMTAETGKCISINDPMKYCNKTTNITACNEFSGCEWCETSSVCVPKGSSECVKCDDFTNEGTCNDINTNTHANVCYWCESEEKCHPANYNCFSCNGLGMDSCNALPGCCYHDDNCRERRDGCGWNLTLYTAEDFIEFTSKVNSGSSFVEDTIYLGNDIDFDGALSGTHVPIGTYDNEFLLKFDGQGYVISNLAISSTTQYAGLFGFTSGVIKNVVLDSTCSVTWSHTSEYAYAGGIAGHCRYCTLSNVVNMASVVSSGTVSKDMYLGGVVGYTYDDPQIPNSANYGSVTFSGISANVYIGGVIGAIGDTSYNYVSNCANYGKITNGGIASAGMLIGGIVGYLSYGASLSNCLSAGKISSANGAIGSIVGGLGESVNIELEHCYWTSDVDCGNMLGNSSKTSTTTIKSTALATMNAETMNNLNDYITQGSFSDYDKWFMLNLNGGSINGITQQTMIVTTKRFPKPTKEGGSTFVDWYTDAAFTKVYDPRGENEGVTAVYALWMSEYVEVVFGKKVTKDDVEELVNKNTNGKFIIKELAYDEATGETKATIGFASEEEANGFVDVISSSSNPEAGLIKKVTYGDVGSLSLVLNPLYFLYLFF